MKNRMQILLLSFLFLKITNLLPAQIYAPLPSSLELPRVSPKAIINQRIGITDIKIDYSRPSVRGRELLGGVVGYNRVWRAGANETTTISFSHDLRINDNSLKSGKYGLFMIPKKDGNWTLIFSKDHSGWGSFTYDEKQDALRIEVKAEKASSSCESLTYTFDNPTRDSVEVHMLWGDLKLSFKVSIDVDTTVIANIRKELKAVPGAGGNWMSWHQGAAYVVAHHIESSYDEAKGWIQQSIARNENFRNLITLSQLEELAGEKEAALKTKEKAFNKGSARDLRSYAFNLMGRTKFDKNRNEALRILKIGLKNYPEHMLSHAGMGVWYATQPNITNKDREKAINHLKKAKEIAAGRFPLLEGSWDRNIKDLSSQK